jgi:hypothetical protein
MASTQVRPTLIWLTATIFVPYLWSSEFWKKSLKIHARLEIRRCSLSLSLTHTHTHTHTHTLTRGTYANFSSDVFYFCTANSYLQLRSKHNEWIELNSKVDLQCFTFDWPVCSIGAGTCDQSQHVIHSAKKYLNERWGWIIQVKLCLMGNRSHSHAQERIDNCNQREAGQKANEIGAGDAGKT